jgi:thioredoxin reductase
VLSECFAPGESAADSTANGALPADAVRRYEPVMADEPRPRRITRRTWLRAGAALGAAAAIPACHSTSAQLTRGRTSMSYDVVIIGGGPAGLSAALTLGRARRRVLLCDSGPRRNAPAVHLYNFVTRDGATPEEFRRVAREQLAAYPNVVVQDVLVGGVTGARGAFRVAAGPDIVDTRRILLCTGMVDEMLPLDGFRELWGHAVVQCPFCHGWEARDRPWGYLVRPDHAAHLQPFALQLRGWTNDLCVFTNGAFDVPATVQRQLTAALLRIETARIERLVANGQRLEAVELSNGTRVGCELLFAHPPQHQVDVVRALDVRLDGEGFVQVDPMTRQTSVPGVFAAGDLTTRMQAAIAAAASGMQAAAMINAELSMEPGPP